MPDDQYSLGDLARLAGVTPRTVRYYVAQGLLPSPDAAGPATRYGENHLARLRLIRRLQRDHLPLAEIRARLEQMGDEEVVAAAAALDPQEPDPSLDRDATLGFVRSLMQRAGVRPSVAGAPGGATRSVAPPMAASVPAPMAAKARANRSASAVASPLPLQETATTAQPLADAPSPAPAVSAARSGPDRTTWERLSISSDVELHVRRPLDRQTNKRIDQLERIARELFEDA